MTRCRTGALASVKAITAKVTPFIPGMNLRLKPATK
jgi:hypothetical protein